MKDSKDQFQSGLGGLGDRGVATLERPKPPPEPPGEPEVHDDAGSQALSEALRSSFVIVKILMGLLVLIFIFSGVFTVPSQQRAIVLRFGKPVGTGEQMLLEPGLHFAWPGPIDEIIFIPTSPQTVRSTVGWYAFTPEQELAKEKPEDRYSLNPAADGYTITGDTNIVHVRASVNFRIAEPLKYALNFVIATNMVQNVLDSSVVWASARTKVDDALQLDRLGFQERVLNRFDALADQQNLGIKRDSGFVEIVASPGGVANAFAAATAADAERSQAIEKAKGEASRILSAAHGEATNIVNLAETDRTRLVESVRAESQAFLAQLPHYEANPQLFQSRVRSEAMQHALTNAGIEKFFWGRRAQQRLQLSREPQKPPAAPQP